MAANARFALLAFLFTAAGLAQPAPNWKFAVASVKPAAASNLLGRDFGFKPGGKFHAANFPLIFVIGAAYDLPFQSQQLTGGPDWIRSQGFDIDAAADPESLPPGLPDSVRRERLRAMLRSLLADRFHLVIKTETKEMQVYAQVVAKGGLKLQKSEIAPKDCDDSNCHVFMGGRGRGMHSKAADLGDLAHYVSNWTDHPVVDQTRIAGLWAIDTKPWLAFNAVAPAPGQKAEDGSEAGDLATVFDVFAAMGLRLDLRKAPVELFHIESIEQPTAN